MPWRPRLSQRRRQRSATLHRRPLFLLALLPLWVLLLVALPRSTQGFLHGPKHQLVRRAATVQGVLLVAPRFFKDKQQQEQEQQPPEQQRQQGRPTAAPLVLSPSTSDSSSQYEELMGALTDDEKYNILLQSRASAIIELLGGRGSSGSGSNSGKTPEAEFEPVYRLLEEMTAKGVKLTGKSFAALMDAASLSRSLRVIQACLVQARRNGVCQAFSRDVGGLAVPPPRSTATMSDALSPVPSDNRSLEVGAGLGALAVVGGALGWEALAPLFHLDTTPAALLLLLVGIATVLDVTQRQGKELRLVLAGLNRLFLRDPEREARVQAATFLSAYLLGLPCFCFSPSVLEALRLPVEVPEDFQDALASTAGLNRLLVYLLAPVAVEEANHVQLVASDPRQARALVQLFKERNPGMEADGEGVLLPWAFQEARRLLRANGAVLEQLRKRMESGGATVGDCVSLVESAVVAGGGGKGDRGEGGRDGWAS